MTKRKLGGEVDLELLPDAALRTDPDGTVVAANGHARALLGRESGALLGERLSDLFVGATPPELGAPALRGRVVHRARVERADGDVLSVELTASRAPDGGVVTLWRSLDHRRDAVAELLAVSDRFRHALRASRAGAWEWNMNTDQVYWSEENFAVMGLDPTEDRATYERWLAAVHPDDRHLAENAVRRALEERSDLDIEFRVVWPDGTVHWVRDIGKLVFDAKGEPRAMYGILLDVTDRRRAERERAEAEERLGAVQRLEAIGRLAGGVAHDFNNLLTSLLGLVDEAAEHLSDSHPAASSLRHIRQTAERATELTRDLLAFGQRQPRRPERFDLAARTERTASVLGRLLGDDIELRVEIEASPWVEADPSHLDQVLLNLAANARDAMPSGGTATIRVAEIRVDEGRAGPNDLHPGRYAELTFRDEGVGMDAATAGRVFDPFFTTKRGGAGIGLGLSTVHGIVHQNGGEIGVETSPGEGTAFRMLLPAVPSIDIAEGESRRPKARDGTATILLAEDEDMVRNLVRRTLERAGHRVLVAEGKVSAVAQLEQHAESLDLLLTDVVMRDGTGIELAEAARAQRPDLPVLYMSGHASDALERHGMSQSDAPLLPKPFTPSELREVVAKILAGETPDLRTS